ncbi:5199_t:CDS:2 [Funneliformis caledonium]|uniref:5199_t:CDS:1 n=1 Tax=Funneliformis caledonium TaxID=1117310 RepID=A0A9N9CZR3_9GLOM|nr:5199_t:CDS:2 [Funneliformis caledonium]
MATIKEIRNKLENAEEQKKEAKGELERLKKLKRGAKEKYVVHLSSLKDVMNMILSNFSTLKKSSEIAEAKVISLKGHNFSNDLEKIQNNIENSKKYEWGRPLRSSQISEFLKTHYGKELFEEVKQKILIIEQLISFQYIFLNFSNDIQLDGSDSELLIEILVIYHNELVEVIIYRCFAVIPSMKSDLLLVKYSDTLESLKRDQHLILINYAENDNHVLITLLPIFIYLYIQTLKPFVVAGKLRMSFLPGWRMEWYDFEILVAEYVAFRIRVFLYFRYKKVAFKNIFQNAYDDKMSLETKVELKEITVHQLCNKFLATYPITNKQGKIVNFKLGVIVNENKISFADSFLVFVNIGYFEKTDMKKEHNKNVAAVQSTYYNFGINNYNVIIVFISSADFKKDISGYCEESLPNCLIIYWHNFEDFFGHVLSCHAAMQISRECNPNFTPPDRWLSVSTKIPPLCSPQDMFNADPWFNNYKDDINNMTYSLYTDTIELANFNKKRQLSYYDEVLQL